MKKIIILMTITSLLFINALFAKDIEQVCFAQLNDSLERCATSNLECVDSSYQTYRTCIKKADVNKSEKFEKKSNVKTKSFE